MRKTLAVVLLTLVFGTAGFAQGHPSAKATVQVADLTLISQTVGNGPWVTILGDEDPFDADAVTIKTSQQKDLFFSVAIECGLFTRTLVRSKGNKKDTSTAEATVDIQVVLDPGTVFERTAEPGVVTYCERVQELSAKLQGIIENLACFVDDDDDPATPPVFDPDAPGCELTPEEIELVLNTLNANAFFFVLDDIGTGVHNVIVQAKIDTDAAKQEGEAEAEALVGKGAVVVEEVRLIKGEDIVLE